MSNVVGLSAQCMCTMGTAPAPLIVLPQNKVLGETKPIATIQDNKPIANITPFVMCKSLGHPAVKPPFVPQAPCIPNTAAPWTPGSPTVLIGGVPALNNSCKLACNYGGLISIITPGTTKVMVK